MKKQLNRDTQRRKRHLRIRKRVVGTAERPRLAVWKGLRHVIAQLIDDTQGHTLAFASTLEKGLRPKASSANVASAEAVGKAIADRAKAIGVEEVVFDRGGLQYHGAVAALADAARKAGMRF
jgi:large subunit ribosomal protein L18